MPEGEKFDYTNGTLILDSDGKAAFKLKHGETITILNIPENVQVRIVEIDYSGYDASFTDDHENCDHPRLNDTGFMLVGKTGLNFKFLNETNIPPPTGIDEGSGIMTVVLVATVLVLLAGFAVSRFARKAFGHSQPPNK
jgi:hypothetical protein